MLVLCPCCRKFGLIFGTLSFGLDASGQLRLAGEIRSLVDRVASDSRLRQQQYLVGVAMIQAVIALASW